MKKNVVEKIKADNCCGCGACSNACPVGVISMQENKEGFLAPPPRLIMINVRIADCV